MVSKSLVRRAAPLFKMYRMTRQASPSPARAQDARSPFVRLRELLGDMPPGKPAISMAVGEPQHPIPPFVGPVIAAHIDEFGRYPMNKGLDAFGEAVAKWLNRRYALERPVDPCDRSAGAQRYARRAFSCRDCREKLGEAARRPARPCSFPIRFMPLIPPARSPPIASRSICRRRRQTGFLPDLNALSDDLLARTVAFYLASPSNPQGAVADRAYLGKLAALAQRFGFVVFCDECYCEIYSDRPPPGMLEAAAPDFANVVVFHSLSKRSSLPGLRVGFAAGDRRFLAAYLELRNVAAPQVAMPAQRVAIAAYGDETHVDENRRLYREKFDLADQIVGDRYGYRRPAGGFFLWLNVAAQGGSEAATLALWKEAGVRVVPGRYLAREQADGSNPGADYIRVAMVQSKDITADALHRLVAVLG